MLSRIYRWLWILFSGTVLFGVPGQGCVADALRDMSDEIDNYADEIDNQDGWDEISNDIEDWFD